MVMVQVGWLVERRRAVVRPETPAPRIMMFLDVMVGCVGGGD